MSPAADSIDQALSTAVIEQLEDGSFAGTIPGYVGVLAFADGPEACEAELRSTLEDWIQVGRQLGHLQ